MAADTAQKRYSAYDLGCPWRGPRVLPSGSVSASARAVLLHLYGFATQTVVPAGLTEETDSVFAVFKLKLKTVGLLTETDSSLAVARNKTRLTELNVETDSGLALTSYKVKAVGLNAETDAAQPVDFTTYVLIGQASETDEAHAVSKLKKKVVGLALEFDSSRRVVIAATVAWGLKFPLIRPIVRTLLQTWRSRRFPWKEPY